MTSRTFKRTTRLIGRMACFGLLLVSPLWAQQSMITLDGDVRLFAVLSALHAAGLSFGPAASPGVDAVRQRVQDAIDKDVPSELREKLKQFYASHQEGTDRSAELSKYMSLALVLDQPPKWGFVWSHDKLPPDVLPIEEFQPLVKEFYEATHLEKLWGQTQPALESYIETQQVPIMRTIQQTEAYLRLPSSSYLGRRYSIAIDMLGASSAALARNYGEDYYLVISPAPRANLDEIRHQFLHFVLDPLSLKYANRFYHKQALMEVAAKNPNLDPQFRKDFMLYAIECVIRAAELRMRKLPTAKADDELTRNAATGFFLIKHFYNQLQEFEKGEQGIREALGDMVESIDMEAEKKYAASLPLVTVPPTPAPPKRPRTENEKKLDEAEDLISEEKYELAKKIFRQIADSDADLRSKALYGLGVACSLQRNPEDARSYFEQAIADKNADSATKAWSHVYLGRLFDLEGERESALREYAAAVQLGEDTRGALAAAKRGLDKPFGEKLRPEK
ncbi:MAG: tetratricopeptide repeat protein [Acidobacteriia bacterium]|nr:tetratricopeptide repeat protein [Terriglobia bacterium]